jgi:radical SAM protein with 4Fe4S-binding SPASM domain
VTGFYIDSAGHMGPCVMTPDIRYDISERRFIKGWADIIWQMMEKKAAPDFMCRGCEKINLCGYCPAFFRLENGAEDMPSEYICRMGNLRYQRITDHCTEGDAYDS